MDSLDAEGIACLKKLALLGALSGPIKISTQNLGDMLGTSQQTASRRLLFLERAGMISRTADMNGQFVLVNALGEEQLRREFAEYCQVFDASNIRYVMKGTVVSGVGEGRYYMSIPHYQEQFSELCGFSPYPGTLNVKLNPQSMQVRNKIESLGWKIVPGFHDEHRQFGDARCLLCTISKIPCAIVAPLRTHHPSEIIEVISGVRLREELGVNDGSPVEVVIK